MMRQIHDSKYQTISIDEDNSIISVFWKSTSEKLTEAQFMEESILFAQYFEQHQAKKVLGNTKFLGFIIEPNIQEWIIKEFSAKLSKFIIEKIAIVVPCDLMIQLSVEQTIESQKNGKFSIKQFLDEESAIKWLKI